MQSSTLSGFGSNYAVLNLDLMSILIDAVEGTEQGQAFIANCTRWNDAVHKQKRRPLTVFTTLCFAHHTQPELASDGDAPFVKLLDTMRPHFVKDAPAVQIDPKFLVDENDIVFQKTRWYAGAGNSLEQILQSQKVDTVIISGLSFTGVVMSTVYRLFDLDYNIIVISDNVLELPPHQTDDFKKILLDTLLPKMRLKVVSIDEALETLKQSQLAG